MADNDGLHVDESRRVDLGDGLWALLPSEFVVEAHSDYDVTLRLDRSEQDGVRVAEAVIRRRSGGRDIDAGGFRKIRIGEITTSALANAIQVTVPGEADGALNPVALVMASIREQLNVVPEESRRRLPDDEGLRLIGTLHRAATIAGLPAQRFLMDGLGITKANANYWIGAARKRGFIPPTGGQG